MSLTPNTDSAAKGGVRVLGAGTSVPFLIYTTLHLFKLWHSSQTFYGCYIAAGLTSFIHTSHSICILTVS